MRCLTIADALADLLGSGEDVCFLTGSEEAAGLVQSKSAWGSLPEDATPGRGIGLDRAGSAGGKRLPRRYQVLSLGTQVFQREEELSVLGRVARSDGADRRVFLVDSYEASDAYLEGLRPLGEVWLLDDLCAHAYPVDGILNYHPFASLDAYQRLYGQGDKQCPNAPKFGLGSAYAPIRPQFLGKGEAPLKDRVRQVLITTGGGDADNIAAKVLAAIWEEDCVYHVVVGRFHPHLSWWRKQEEAQDRLQVHVDVADMASLMASCDLAVTAGGSTIYELASVGLPFLCFSYAKNQEALTEYIGSNQIAGFAGAYHKDPIGTLQEMGRQFRGLVGDKGLRSAYSEAEKRLVDGRGAWRAAALLMGEDGKRR